MNCIYEQHIYTSDEKGGIAQTPPVGEDLVDPLCFAERRRYPLPLRSAEKHTPL